MKQERFVIKKQVKESDVVQWIFVVKVYILVAFIQDMEYLF